MHPQNAEAGTKSLGTHTFPFCSLALQRHLGSIPYHLIALKLKDGTVTLSLMCICGRGVVAAVKVTWDSCGVNIMYLCYDERITS